jgi:pimeloyl-ACP methyl ester carboxylesterase
MSYEMTGQMSISGVVWSLSIVVALLFIGCDTVANPETIPPPETERTESQSLRAIQQVSESCITGTQSSGALYEICRTEASNGNLLLYAHGFLFPQLHLQIPEQEGGINVVDFAISRGFDYAATSYYTNGVVEPNKGGKDIGELIAVYTRHFGRPERVFVVSFSNGTLLSMLALEKQGHRFDGALASCGPHGSYIKEIQYLTDVFVLFDFFFSDVAVIPGFGTGMPGGPEGIPQSLLDGLGALAPPGFTAVDVLAQLVLTALQNNPNETQQLLSAIQGSSSLSRGQALFASPSEGVEVIIRAIAYNVFATNDALEKLRGAFFDNRGRVYGDLLPDEGIRQALNSGVRRYEADPSVTAQLESRYESSGHLRTPVVALHNTRDPLVPFWHELLYLEDLGPRASSYTLLPIDGFGHCVFTPEQVGEGLEVLLQMVADVDGQS